MQSPNLLKLISNPLEGSEQFVSLILDTFSTQTLDPLYVETVYDRYKQTGDTNSLLAILSGLSSEQIHAVLPKLIDDETLRSSTITKLLALGEKSPINPRDLLVQIHLWDRIVPIEQLPALVNGLFLPLTLYLPQSDRIVFEQPCFHQPSVG